MAKRSISDDASAASGNADLRELEWAVAKTLLDANAHTVQAFEYHLLRTYRDDATPDLESMQSNIRQAIDEHEKIVEELEVAAQAVGEMRRKEAAEMSAE